jgi:diguanylate cyclase (GGDEF)-like protein
LVTVISRFKVRNGMEEAVRQAFLNRPGLVENAPGFRGFNVLTDASDPSIFLLLTEWTDEESFRTWHRSEAHHESHLRIPKGLKLDASFTSVTIANRLQLPSETQSLKDALESHSAEFSEWLANSESVLAVVLAPDGAFRGRNGKGRRIFPGDSSAGSAGNIFDHLVSSDVDHLRQRLMEAEPRLEDSFLLNLTEGERSPVTWEVRLLRTDEGFLLLGTPESRHDSNFQAETLALTNELSMAMRELAQKNRELQRANETIEMLARVDSLTGLANRRMLEETLPREVMRAERHRSSLSVIFIDLDGFKAVNDRYGHKIGDLALASAGTVIKRHLRPYDLAARFGGDEFVLLLTGTAREAALRVAERIREEFAELTVPGCSERLKVSLGVACRESGETAEELVARADGALYRAKKKGGNRAEAA